MEVCALGVPSSFVCFCFYFCMQATISYELPQGWIFACMTIVHFATWAAMLCLQGVQPVSEHSLVCTVQHAISSSWFTANLMSVQKQLKSVLIN